METAGHKSAGAAGGKDGASGGGQLCNLCGYKYASAHPSAKHRRAHKKHCGGGGGAKSPPAAAAATAEAEEERQGKKLLLAEAGGGNGAAPSDSGGGVPGSAQDVGNAVEDGDNGVHSSPNSAGVTVIIDDVTSEVAPKGNGTEIQTEAAIHLSGNTPHAEDLHPYESPASGGESQDASASLRQSEPEDRSRFIPDLSADEISKSDGQSLALNAAAGEIVEGQSATTVEEDVCADDLGVVMIEQIPSEETPSKEEMNVIRTGSVEQALRSEDPSTDKHVRTDDFSGDDLSELVPGGCHLEATNVKMEQQTDPTSVVAEELTNSKQTDLEEGKSYPDADEVIQAAWSATGPAGSTGDLTMKEPSEVTTEDGIQSNSDHTSGTVSVPSQIDLEEPTSEPTSHEINMIRKEDCEEAGPNENISADLISCDRTEAQSVDTEETASHETKAVCGTDNIEEIKQIEEITTEASSLKSSISQNTISLEEKELTEEVDVISSRDIVVEKEQSDVCIGSAHEIDVVNIPANVEFKKHNEETTTDPTACETDIMNITDSVEEKKLNEETTTDLAPHAISVIHNTSNDDKMQNEDMSEVPGSHEKAVADGTDIIEERDEEPMSEPTSSNMDAVSTGVVEGKKQEEEATAEPTSGINVVHAIENVKEKESEGPASSCKIDSASNADSILAVDPNSHENNTSKGTNDAEEKNQNEKDHADDNIQVAQTIDDVAGNKHKIDSGSNADSILAGDPDSHENNTSKGTDDAEEKNQNEKDHADVNIQAGETTDDDADKKHKDENTTREINTTETANGGQNEEITDKEMTVDSDKSHVSLKSLLSEKGMETTKEKKATSTKDRVLSFRRRSSKDNPSPGKPGSVEQDWNSPARLLPVEKSPKGKKQPWMPFICCHSMN